MMGQRLLLVISVVILAGGGCASDEDGSTSTSTESQSADSSPPTVTDTRDWTPVLTLAEVADGEPMRISTVIGDLEFTNLEITDDKEVLTNVLATPHGLVAGTFGSLRWSTDGGLTWEGITAGPARDLSTADDDVVALDDEGAVRYSWNGTEWSEVGRLDLDYSGSASTNRVRQLVFGPTGAVAIASDASIHSSADGVHFVTAEPGLDKNLLDAPEAVGCGSEPLVTPEGYEPVVSILATDAGYVALTPADPIDWGLSPTCEPVLWSSVDGSTWKLVSQDLPFGPGAFVTMIGERSGRFVAIGGLTQNQQTVGQGAVWVSDDGLSWQQVEFDALRTVSIAGGELGWMLTGWSEAGLPGESMWFSTDGVSWDGPFDLPAGLATDWVRSQPVIGSDIIFGTSNNAAAIARLQP